MTAFERGSLQENDAFASISCSIFVTRATARELSIAAFAGQRRRAWSECCANTGRAPRHSRASRPPSHAARRRSKPAKSAAGIGRWHCCECNTNTIMSESCVTAHPHTNTSDSAQQPTAERHVALIDNNSCAHVPFSESARVLTEWHRRHEEGRHHEGAGHGRERRCGSGGRSSST